MLKDLRNIFFTGLLVLTPVVVTIWVFYQLFIKIDGVLGGKLIQLTGRKVPGMGVVAVLLLILFAGVLARNYIIKKLIQLAEHVMGRIPLFNKIYSAIQQISQALFSGRQAVFQRTVLIEFPQEGSYTIGFQTSEVKWKIDGQPPQKLLSIFLPTTPNPTTGYLLFLPKEKVHPLKISIEDAIKMIISGGSVIPKEQVEIHDQEARILESRGKEGEDGSFDGACDATDSAVKAPQNK